MATSSTGTVYAQVIEDVISNISEEFISNGGPGEGVLTELQGLWELKMMQAGAILGPTDRSSMKLTAPGVHDLNVPYEGPEEYETPTADLLFREDFPSQYRPGGYIPQQDGAGNLIADNSEIYNYQGVVNEDYNNVANTPAPLEIQAPTPAMVNQNDILDDDDDEHLNENDDEDDDLDDVDQGDEVKTYHLILA